MAGALTNSPPHLIRCFENVVNWIGEAPEREGEGGREGEEFPCFAEANCPLWISPCNRVSSFLFSDLDICVFLWSSGVVCGFEFRDQEVSRNK